MRRFLFMGCIVYSFTWVLGSFSTINPLYMGRNNAEKKNKYDVLAAMAKRPDLTTYEAAYLFGVNRHTIGIWCKEAGISLAGHKHPRAGFILKLKQKKRLRLIKELAVIEREIKALKALDPSAPYIKPKK